MIHQRLARSSHDPYALVSCREPVTDRGAEVAAVYAVETHAAGQFASMEDHRLEAVAVCLMLNAAAYELASVAEGFVGVRPGHPDKEVAHARASIPRGGRARHRCCTFELAYRHRVCDYTSGLQMGERSILRGYFSLPFIER